MTLERNQRCTWETRDTTVGGSRIRGRGTQESVSECGSPGPVDCRGTLHCRGSPLCRHCTEGIQQTWDPTLQAGPTPTCGEQYQSRHLPARVGPGSPSSRDGHTRLGRCLRSVNVSTHLGDGFPYLLGGRSTLRVRHTRPTCRLRLFSPTDLVPLSGVSTPAPYHDTGVPDLRIRSECTVGIVYRRPRWRSSPSFSDRPDVWCPSRGV